MEAPKDDLISKLVVEQLKPGHIEKSDAVQIAYLLLVAGNATMVSMIALVRNRIICILYRSIILTARRVSMNSFRIRCNWRN